MTTVVRMRRADTSTPWGFRMNGGSEYDQPLYVQKVTKSSISWRCGLRPGDGIEEIGGTPTAGFPHDKAKMSIIREGNDLVLKVTRNVVEVGDGTEIVKGELPRAIVAECSTPWRATVPVQNPAIQSRSFKILQTQLQTPSN